MDGHVAKNTVWDVCTDCAANGGIGVTLSSGGKCWAHADDQDINDALKRLGEDGRLDARGVPITATLLERLLAAAPHDDHDNAVLTEARFDHATFHDNVWFRRTTFKGETGFDHTTFHGNLTCGDVIFHGNVSFELATFKGDVRFSQATFKGSAWFEAATFQRYAWFNLAIFEDAGWFLAATFESIAVFDGAIFQRLGMFDGVAFHDSVEFNSASFHGCASFVEATFNRAKDLGPMLVRKKLAFDDAVFHERLRIEATAAGLCCRRARFLAGVHLRIRWAQIVLDDADLAAPSILTGAPAPFSGPSERRWARALAMLRALGSGESQPRLVSLRRADVAGLTVSNVDLRACRFLGVHSLDKIRFEGFHRFAHPPGSRLRTRRCTLAEEHHWWHEARKADDWYPQVCRFPAWGDIEQPACPEPIQIASLYRALRKGREDAKDEPGAADFYYGEMEMRRHGTRWSRPERWLLTLYWLTSGYALRAWRAVIAWAVLVVIGAVAFAGFGFKPPASPQIVALDVSRLGQAVYQKRDVPHPSSLEQFPDALAFSAESTVSALRATDRPLTLSGRWVQMALRVFGPVLFGLWLLSLRGRVKR